MVQDRHTFSIKVVCALSNDDIADDLQWPLTATNHPIFIFCTEFHVFAWKTILTIYTSYDVYSRKDVLFVGTIIANLSLPI